MFLPQRRYGGIPGPGIEPTPHSGNQSHSGEKAGASTRSATRELPDLGCFPLKHLVPQIPEAAARLAFQGRVLVPMAAWKDATLSPAWGQVLKERNVGVPAQKPEAFVK